MSDAEDRANDLRDAADRSAGLARNLYFTFLLLAAYIAVIIGSTTDEQLLKVSPVTLPILNVGMPIVAFYAVIPWLVLLFHFNLLLQMYLLARKLHRFDAALSDIDDQNARLDQRARLFPFPFSHMLIGIQHGLVMRFLFALMVWVTILFLPLLLLVWAQVRFLPYHDEVVTWGHRAAVLFDLGLAWVFWPIIVAPDGRARSWWRGVVTGPRRWIGMLTRWRNPKRAPGDMDRRHSDARGLPTLALTSLAALTLSYFVALLPGEALDQNLARTAVNTDQKKDRNAATSGLFGLTTILFDAPGAPFHRNLRLADKTLTGASLSPRAVADLRGHDAEKRAAAVEQTIPVNLSNRDLRFADLRNVILPKANLRGANLDGADLRNAVLLGADLRPFDPEGGRCVQNQAQRQILKEVYQAAAGLTSKKTDIPVCVTSLQATRLMFTRMDGAKLQRARLQGADLSYAELDGANLRYAQLDKARLFKTQLEGADLRSAILLGANLEIADLQRADLSRADLTSAVLRGTQLDGAILSKANLSGAYLNHASLVLANLTSARLLAADLGGARLVGAKIRAAFLSGADLRDSRLHGVDFSRANLSGAILFRATLGGTGVSGTNFRYVDLRQLKFAPLTLTEYRKLEKYLSGSIRDVKAVQKMLPPLERLVDRTGSLRAATKPKMALCNDDRPFGGCLPVSENPRFVALLVKNVLAPIACESTPVARAFLWRMFVRRGEPIPFIERKVALAKALLAPGCPAGVAAAPDFIGTLESLCRGAQAYGVACNLPAIAKPAQRKVGG